MTENSTPERPPILSPGAMIANIVLMGIGGFFLLFFLLWLLEEVVCAYGSEYCGAQMLFLAVPGAVAVTVTIFALWLDRRARAKRRYLQELASRKSPTAGD